MSPGRDRRVIACLHDVSPRSFSRILEIDRFYAEVGVGSNYAMLVVPNFHGEWSLEEHPEFVDWLKMRAWQGVEIFLHGYFHYDTTPEEERAPLTRLRHAVLGEGEFAALEEDEAARRLKAGREMLGELLHMNITSFVAPAWQYSNGARAALSALGFTIAENRAGVWRPDTGCVLTQTPVIAYSGRGAMRRCASLAWSKISSRLLENAQIVRHAIHPADFNDESLKIEIRRSLSELLASREAISYRRLLEERTLH